MPDDNFPIEMILLVLYGGPIYRVFVRLGESEVMWNGRRFRRTSSDGIPIFLEQGVA